MISITIRKYAGQTDDTQFLISPKSISLGAQNAHQVDQLFFICPEDWADCTVRVTFVPTDGQAVAYLLDETHTIAVDAAVTAQGSGTFVLDACRSDNAYHAYTGAAEYRCAAHPPVGGDTAAHTPDSYEQLVAQVTAAKADLLAEGVAQLAQTAQAQIRQIEQAGQTIREQADALLPELTAAAYGSSMTVSADDAMQLTLGQNRIRNITLQGRTIQSGSGTPSRTNIRAISGTGETGSVTITVNDTGYTLPLQGALFAEDTLDTCSLSDGAAHCVETHHTKLRTLTGEENWSYGTNSAGQRRRYILPYTEALPVPDSNTIGQVLCDRYMVTNGAALNAENATGVAVTTGGKIQFADADISSLSDWKAYVAAQYAAGTPLTILYRLAEPEVYTTDSVEISHPAGNTRIAAPCSLTATFWPNASQRDLDALVARVQALEAVS